jgi:hypothetical protein
MQVNGPTSLLQVLLATEAKRPAAAPFVAEPAAPPMAPQAQVATPAQSVQMLVTLAATMQEPERRRRIAAQEAEKGLDALGMLQAALIVGVSSAEPVRELKHWSENRVVPEDPELAEIMDEIDLRIQVELAKRERD